MNTHKYMRLISLLMIFILPLYSQRVEDLEQKDLTTAKYSLEPPLSDLLPAESLEHVKRLDGVLQGLVHRYLLENEASFDLTKHQLVFGGTYSDFHSISENKPFVDFTVRGKLQVFLDALKQIDGMVILATASTSSYHVVSALVPVNGLLEATNLPEFAAAHAVTSQNGRAEAPPGQKVRSQGVADNQAETALHIDDLRRVYAWADGTGINVGTLSDSVDRISGGISDSQATGDLPANDRIHNLIDWTGADPTDEGRAMMEHIFDIAPGLETMGFATAFGGVATFAANITALADDGMHIINDDVIYFTEPIFQDGVVAQAVNSFVESGGIYFALNHNYANLSYEKIFNDGDDADTWHEYTPGVEVATLTISAGTAANPTRTTLAIQWAQPWGNATTDFAIDLWNSDVTSLLYSSPENNIGGDPIDIILINNTGAEFNYEIAIRLVSGSAENLAFKYTLYANGAWQGDLPDYNEDATGTLTPHAGTPLSIAIGAAPYYEPDVAEDYSGHGPHRRYLNEDGVPITPYTFTKPDFIAVDKCNTTFFGRDIPEDVDGLPNFSGTSAATPNAAAVAALMLEMAGGPGSLSAADIRTAMRVSAIDYGDEGHDTVYGYGGIHALGATIAAQGPRSTEYYIYLNQYGDARMSWALSGNTDLDVIEFSSNFSGLAKIDIYENDVNMDPMMVLFNRLNNSLIDVDYDSGPGDDARFYDSITGLFPYVIQVLTEESISSSVPFSVFIDGPAQSSTDRTSFLNSSGEDPGFSGSLVTQGDSDFITYTAPLIGPLTIELEPSGFNAFLRVYDDSGFLIASRLVSDGYLRYLTVDYVNAGSEYAIQIVPNNYSANGSYHFSADFNGISVSTFNAWRRTDASLCGTTAPNILVMIDYLNHLGCSSL